MTLEMMKELFGITHIRDNEEEVPNAKHMRVAERRSCCHIPSLLQSRRASTRLEEEFLLGPPVTVPPEEDEVPILQGPSVVVSPKEEVLPEEEEFPTPAVTVPHGPSVVVLPEKEEVPAAPPPCCGPVGRKGMPCPYTDHGNFLALLFSQKRRRFFSPFFLINVVDL
jgi:hypothetical protein